jgi:microcystin-dependent protein
MNYKLIIIIILILILLILIYKNKKNQEENFTLEEVLQNMISVYEESDGTLSFQNLKANGDTSLKRLIVNSTFLTKQGLTNINGDISNSGTGGIINTGAGGITNTGGNITNRGQIINTGSVKITENLDVNGDISGNLVSLKGMILMWSGTIGTIPNGWALCDGTKGTPDLRSRFIVGASTPGGSLAAGLTVKQVNDKGGTEKETLTVEQMPSHTHPYWDTRNAYASGHTGASAAWNDNTVYMGNTGPTGGGQPHNNMPPYFTLAYIMKI